MKKTLIAAALIVCAGSAFADPTAVLQVQGKLTNASCTPELSNGGVVDYGYIHLSSLSATEANQLGHKNITLTVTCTAPTKVGFSTEDDQQSTSIDISVENATFSDETYAAKGGGFDYRSYKFGVGLTDGDVKIGAYTTFIDLDALVADGKTVDAIYRQKGSDKWTSASVRNTFQNESYRTFTVASTGTLEPMAFTQAEFPLTTSLAIQGTSTLNITDDTPINGQATITLQYL
jgi:hypothetical protein